jgi:hypothetical protein
MEPGRGLRRVEKLVAMATTGSPNLRLNQPITPKPRDNRAREGNPVIVMGHEWSIAHFVAPAFPH